MFDTNVSDGWDVGMRDVFLDEDGCSAALGMGSVCSVGKEVWDSKGLGGTEPCLLY